MKRPVSVGVFGASGTSGTELVSLIAGHPRCSLGFATSREFAGASLRTVDPAAVDVVLEDPSRVRADNVDVAFICLPHGAAAAVALEVYEQGTPVIDLSGDLRLRAATVHQRVYATARSESLAGMSVYGLTEFAREQIAGARVVANPGCYPTASALALAPLARCGALGETVVINALSGVSGGGRRPTADNHFCAVAGDVRPYGLGRRHRHLAEIEQTLARLCPDGATVPEVVFCPHVIPIERGMLVTITAATPCVSAEEVHGLFEDCYAREPFIEVRPLGEPARIRAIERTNRAVIGVHPASGRERRVVVTCAIDNLRKGAAGQAVQNMNRMFEFPETTGL